MRLNKYLAAATSLSRRGADEAIASGRVTINGKTAVQGVDVANDDMVSLDNRAITPDIKTMTIMLNKPRGFVVSRNGQGSKSVYDLLPPEYQHLNPVGRLDKDSSGLILFTNDGQQAQELTHPSRQKIKIYMVELDRPLQPLHRQMISDHGLLLEDGLSKLQLERHKEGNDTRWTVRMHEGRNRQIRRTFEALGYTVATLHRTNFGEYTLGKLDSAGYCLVS